MKHGQVDWRIVIGIIVALFVAAIVMFGFSNGFDNLIGKKGVGGVQDEIGGGVTCITEGGLTSDSAECVDIGRERVK